MTGQRILLVDDEVGFTEVLKLNLEALGHFNVRVENEPSHAVRAAQAFKPELILLDIVMPTFDGGRVRDQIRADPQLHNVPIVFLTGTLPHSRAAEPHERNIAGCTILVKPFRFEELIECMERALSQLPAVS